VRIKLSLAIFNDVPFVMRANKILTKSNYKIVHYDFFIQNLITDSPEFLTSLMDTEPFCNDLFLKGQTELKFIRLSFSIFDDFIPIYSKT
jgi:hypothetical protein